MSASDCVCLRLIALFVGQMFNLLMRPLTGHVRAKAERARARAVVGT